MNHQEPVEARTARQHSPTSTRGTRLPDDWQLPDDWRELCAQNRPDLDPDEVAESFRDYWHAKAGRDAFKANWLAVWRNWCRKERQQQHGTPAARPARPGGLLSTDHQF
ncbi:hypothetical protein VITFI_CDS2908 [Vitreoscilla filiformis]|uniref:Uncharacterized protein n=1 Tax=Vitreoscilla filiformis TaxID=63 RepID=A0A221KI93_VITFI|nr:hypothetical protein [Vitreoscilla filiformis]ASM78685.1 hypothetical protein VITFI_CDS2908 [Vitreoscilla filiformis]